MPTRLTDKEQRIFNDLQSHEGKLSLDEAVELVAAQHPPITLAEVRRIWMKGNNNAR